MIPVKLFGLQRTGTNYVSKLILKNFPEVEIIEGNGWKHGHYSAYLFDEPNVIIVSKNPYAWLVSCYKYWKDIPDLGPDLTNKTFEDFVTTSPVMLEGSADIPYLIRATNLIQYYNNMYYHWLSIKFREDRKLCLIRYEDILEYPERTLNDIATTFDLHKIDYENIEEDVRWGWEYEGEIKKFDKIHFYLNNEYLNDYNDNLLKYIEKEWDLWLMDKIGYKLVKSSLFEPYILTEDNL